MDEQSFYLTQSKYSDAGKYSLLFDSFPETIRSICDAVHNLIVHQNDTVEFYKFYVPPDKKLQPNTRYIEKIIEIIVNNNNSPLNEQRKPQERFIGTCRDFALLACSILRHKGIPARVRCGFARYFHSDWYSDHWVCEYFDSKSNTWLLADAELGNEEKSKYHIDFDPTNISRDNFLVAGDAWTKARNNELNPDVLGVKEIDVKGFWFIKANVIRDLAALNKMELLPWDYTEYSDQPFKKISERPDDEIQLVDSVAAITAQEQINFTEVLNMYSKNKNLQITNTVKSYTSTGPIDVLIR